MRDANRATIVLFTDFGLSGPYTGQVQAVLQRMAPGVPALSLFADAPAGQPRPASYLLAAYAAWFPAGSVFLCVVDPGVGGPRLPLVVEADGRRYVGPDNGLFEAVLRRAAAAAAWSVTWRPAGLSASFHGRDLFAPVAARLAIGETPAAMGEPVTAERHREWPDDLAEIVYVDHYGNAMTGLRGEVVPATARLAVGRRLLAHADTFSAVPPGTPFWYVNANGLVEIAVNRGAAAAALSLTIGSAVAVRAAAAPRRRRPEP
ncbi:MAG: S-adenosyl-l-methionine hydroxide adenosyltransferase family protein [Thiohalocapsa sp.]